MANATELKFGDPDGRLYQTRSWSVLLRPKQPTLGSLVLVCREPVRSLAEVSPEGLLEMGDTIGRIEAVLRGFVAYERINYLMLMMVDPDVHFHVIPRYPDSRRHGALEFPDTGWPGVPALEPAVTPDAATAAALVALLRERFAAGDR
jgi:diadenosine tetraphosphate (Ap4A) HIT family hydrolase